MAWLSCRKSPEGREFEAGLRIIYYHPMAEKISVNPAVNGYLFMTPTSKKLRGHIGLGPSVCPLHLLLVVKLENCLS